MKTPLNARTCPSPIISSTGDGLQAYPDVHAGPQCLQAPYINFSVLQSSNDSSVATSVSSLQNILNFGNSSASLTVPSATLPEASTSSCFVSSSSEVASLDSQSSNNGILTESEPSSFKAKVEAAEALIFMRGSSSPFPSSCMQADSVTNSVGDSSSVKTAGKNKKNISKFSMLKFPPCVICDGKASGLHYGCNTCEACKNFYRRYLIGKQAYVCSRGKNDCVISYQKKGNCSACRLAKCLKYGMSKEKSKMGRYSYTRRTETIKKVKELEEKCNQVNGQETSSGRNGIQNSNNDLSSSVVQSVGSPEERKCLGVMTLSEDLTALLIKNMKDIRPFGDAFKTQEAIDAHILEYYEKYMLKIKVFGSLDAISKSEYHHLLKKYGIDVGGHFEDLKEAADGWNVVCGRYCKFAKSIPGFQDLSYADQANLLKATHCDFFVILLHRAYNEKCNIFMDIPGKAYHVEEVADKLYSRECIEKVLKVNSYITSLNLSCEEMVLLLCIVTFTSDVCKLEQPDLVENLRLSYVNCLFQKMNSKLATRDASRRFYKFVDLLIKLRDVALKYFRDYKELCEDDMISSQIPNFNMMYPDEDS